MNRLPKDVEGFKEGLYTAKLSKGNFNNVWLDYTLEVTQNKARKGTGGIIGLTLRENALARWFLARPLTSRYSMTFHNSLHDKTDNDNIKHHTDTKSKREQYNKTVLEMTNLFTSRYIDPFDLTNAPKKLVNFATGVFANKDVEDSMSQCLEKGYEMLESFVSERLIAKCDGSDPPKKFFFYQHEKKKNKNNDKQNCTKHTKTTKSRNH
jgi:hypothetical protein